MFCYTSSFSTLLLISIFRDLRLPFIHLDNLDLACSALTGVQTAQAIEIPPRWDTNVPSWYLHSSSSRNEGGLAGKGERVAPILHGRGDVVLSRVVYPWTLDNVEVADQLTASVLIWTTAAVSAWGEPLACRTRWHQRSAVEMDSPLAISSLMLVMEA